jgi:hypothetical protein
MTVLVVLSSIALVSCVLARPVADWALATLTPPRAVITTCAAALAAALSAGAALTSVAVAYLATWQPIAAEGHISSAKLRALAPVPAWVGLAAGGAVAALIVCAAWRTARIARALYRSDRMARALPGTDPVVFVQDTDVYTVAGLPGRIVVGTHLFERLDVADRQVVLAHEHSHLRHRHHLYVHAVDIAAAANPLLGPLRERVRLAVEQWADEDAARAVFDREMVARALARTALIRSRLQRLVAPQIPAGALAAATLQVTTRVQALMSPAKPLRTLRTALITALAAAVLVAGVANLAHLNELIESAQLHLPHR